MGMMRILFREILHSLAEFEARLSSNRSPLYFRKLFLRFMGVRFDRELWIGPGFRLTKRGNLVLGKHCAIGAHSIIQNPGPIRIGDGFLASSRLTLASGSHDPRTLEPSFSGIEIGDRVWCGVNVTIIDGVHIGDDVVIGAGSVVCSDIPSNCIAVGVPAKRIRSLQRDEEDRLWSWATPGDEE